MTDEPTSGQGDGAHDRLLQSAATIESRLDILHQESRKAAETVTRVRLAIDNVKAVSLQNTDRLEDIASRLARIESKLEKL